MYRAMSQDLGIIFLSDLTFRTHYGNIVSRGYKSLDLIHRVSKFLKDKNTLAIIYFSLIVNWPDILEYCKSRTRYVESVRYKFPRLPGRCIPLAFRNNDHITRSLDLQPLLYRRIIRDITFVYKILRGSITCPSMAYLASINVTSRRMWNNLLSFEQHRTAYGYHSCVNNTTNFINSIHRKIDTRYLANLWNF